MANSDGTSVDGKNEKTPKTKEDRIRPGGSSGRGAPSGRSGGKAARNRAIARGEDLTRVNVSVCCICKQMEYFIKLVNLEFYCCSKSI